MPLRALSKLSPTPAQNFLGFLISRGLIHRQDKGKFPSHNLETLDRELSRSGLIDPVELAKAYARYYQLPFLRLVNRPIRPEVAKLLPEEIARRYVVLPFELNGFELSLAVGEPAKLQENAPLLLIRLRQQKGLKVKLCVSLKSDILALTSKLYRQKFPLPAAPTAQPKIAGPGQALAKPINAPEPAKPTAPPPPLTKGLTKPSLPSKTISLKGLKIAPEVLNRLPVTVAKKYQLIVFETVKPKAEFDAPLIKLAAVKPDDPHVKEIIAYIEQRNKVLVDRYQTDLDSFNQALKLYEAPLKDGQAEITSERIEETPKKSESLAKPQLTPITPLEKNLKDQSPLSAETAKSPATVQPSERGSLTVSSEDIINRPVDQSPEELERLAKEQQSDTQNRDLDRLLKSPVLSADDLAKAFRSGLIPEIVAATLFLAIRMKASDVHIEAEQENVRVRYRIDGILHDIVRVPLFLHAPLISRVKILSKMKIDEQRIPQDGRFDVVIDNRQVDLRVSTLPTVHGEKVVMRLLDKSAGILTLEQLGVTGSNFDTLVRNIDKPYGIILSTGPTGSGKSTTLYAILVRISKPGVNIVTLEDPVEYELTGINQAQVKPQIGFTFADGLRSVLRQDPNVIMVGEVRDLETAAMATHAALTGHLVLSTLHTNDSSGALPRLINMGVEPFLITSSINAVIGQRLVRKICSHCKVQTNIPTAVLEYVNQELSATPAGQLKNLDLKQLVFYHGKGCPSCGSSGYQGRIGIYEVLEMSDEIEDLAVRKAPSSEIKKAAIKAGMITMSQDGLIKALKGITTIDEVLRVTTTEIKDVPGGRE